MLFVRSTYLFVQGCAMVAQWTQMWNSSQNQRNFFLVNYVSLSMMMEFRTPKAMDDVKKEQHGLLELDRRDRPSFYPFCELVYGDKQVGVSFGCLLERPNQINPQTMKGHVMGIS